MRLKELTTEQMTEAQRAVVDEAVAGKRGRVPAPLKAWLYSPELGRRAQRLGEFLRYDTSLGPALSELAILVTGRFWTAHYEWHAHKREALKAGVDPAIIEAIAKRRTPAFRESKSELVYRYSKTLLEDGRVDTALHKEAAAVLGETALVELVGVIGYYSLVAMTLNAFDVGLPEGEAPELLP
jgi:4-carboxymuconolactone decarboxylase